MQKEQPTAPDNGPSAKELAAAEEMLQVQRMAQVKAMQEAKSAPATEEAENIAAIASKGREYLMERLREHAAKQEVKKEEHRPPPMSAKQAERLKEEQEAGRRAQARHQEQWDARPQPKKEVWDGDNVEVARPANMVPDPMDAFGASKPFTAGNREYSSDA